MSVRSKIPTRWDLASNEKAIQAGPKASEIPWSILGCCLVYYLAQPPAKLPLFAWLSCALFAWAIRTKPNGSGRDWWIAWGASGAMWLLLLHGIRLAFWPLTAGWIALSLYLAVYFPASLWISKRLYWDFKFPLALACAVGWTTCELLRAYVITGFACCSLAHSQTPWPIVLQIASHFGHYGVGFMMMLTSAWLVDFLQTRKDEQSEPIHWPKSSLNSIVRTSIFAWMILSYATWTARQNHLRQMEPIKPLGRFVLIQDHMPTMFDATQELIEQGWADYLQTTQRAIESIRERNPDSGKPNSDHVDLIVWPESVYAELSPMMFWDRGDRIPAELPVDRQGLEDGFERLDRNHAFKKRRLQTALGGTLPEMLVGTDVIDIRDGKMNRYNSALWIGRTTTDYYAKNHLVMFGEYIPILSWFPSIMQQIGLGTLSPGTHPKAWELPSGRRLMANVCFEDTVPHLMRRQVNELTRQGMAPDVMINISNDGWFRGSSILDHHLNSAILIAVENRIPVLIAANTGITAWIDGDGQVVERLPKMNPGWILAQPIPDGRTGYWSYWGDWPAILVALCGLLPVGKFVITKK